jgi:magnesium transporter
MFVYYSDKRHIRRKTSLHEGGQDDIVWIDLPNPTRRQEQEVEEFLNIEVPTREEMQAIEVSDRLYQEQGATYMTATLATQLDTAEPTIGAVTFILSHNTLVTLRYCDPLAFATFASQVHRLPKEDQNAASVFMGLLDSVTNRLADVLENVSQEIDGINRRIFGPALQQSKRHEAVDYQKVLKEIGICSDKLSKVRESLMTLARMVAFAGQCQNLPQNESNAARLKAQGKDISGLSDHVVFLIGKINFLLDATLGMVSIEQNDIIKIFSVAAVMFLPPTLIASIYGMNFKHMPEINWDWGYPIALICMGLAALLPYLYFKRKKWL